MARAPDVIVDDSTIDDPRINVPLRVGWLLRTCRLNSRVEPGLSGHRFAASLGVGAAMVTKWEKGSDVIDAAGVAGYERLVDLPPGSLRGLVDITRRYFRQPVGPRLAELPLTDDLEEVSSIVRPTMAGIPTGLDWAHLADALADDGPLRVPDFVAEPVIGRLADELGRSVGGAFAVRYEAMARLRNGRYGDIALRALLDRALAPDSQASAPQLSAAAHRPSAELFVTMIELLTDEREGVFHGAAQALVTMASVGGIKHGIRDAVPDLAAAYNALADHPARHAHVSAMLRNLPPGVLETARPTLVRPLAPVPAPHRHGGQAKVSPVARGVAEAIKTELPTPVDQVLVRVLHEAMFDPRWPKLQIATLFLSALPYTDLVARHVADLAASHDSAEVRQAASLLVLRLGHSSSQPVAERWVVGDDALLQRVALVTLGRTAPELELAMLEKLVVEPDWNLARLVLYAAGMSRSPILADWVGSPSKSEQVRRAAAWWLRRGGRITR